jgi:hypothetical protein
MVPLWVDLQAVIVLIPQSRNLASADCGYGRFCDTQACLDPPERA